VSDLAKVIPLNHPTCQLRLRKHPRAVFSEIAFSSEKIVFLFSDKRRSIDYKDLTGPPPSL
jgi:hypothetical protein